MGEEKSEPPHPSRGEGFVREPSYREVLVTSLFFVPPFSGGLLLLLWLGFTRNGFTILDGEVLTIGIAVVAGGCMWMAFVVGVNYGIRITPEYVEVLSRRFSGGVGTSRIVLLKEIRNPKLLNPKIWHEIGFETQGGPKLVLSAGLARALIRSPHYRGSIKDLESIQNIT